jgi:ubiquinone/menaquinone biosynthesis C-methylase UbiE
MSKTRSIRQVWEGHWAENPPTAAVSLGERFTLEAFRTMRGFTNDSDRDVLEVGCGVGRFCVLFGEDRPQARITGIDYSESALKAARGLKAYRGCDNVSFSCASIFQLPFESNSFDVVFCEGVLQIFSLDDSPTYKDALTEMIRVLKPGGKIIVSVINWHCYPHTLYKWYLEKNGGYEYGYEKSFRSAELAGLFREHGLRNIEGSGYYASYAFFRLGNKLGGKLKSPLHLIGSLVDRLDNGLISKYFGFEIVAVGEK